ncbi:MAG: glycosyltransferase family 1 protein [Chloroflexi bacterium]|nr:MAG: glycosyltransferase family 1 protein [Chloroflexota bacterium]
MIIGIDASRAITTRRTGTEAYAFFLIRALIPLATARGHRVQLYCHQAPPPNFFPLNDQTELIVIPFPRLWTHVRLGMALQQKRPHVFFTPAHVIPGMYFGCSVATVHDLGYRYFPQAHTRWQRVYLEWSTRHNCRRSRRVIADSQATRDDLVRFYGVRPDKIDVIYPAVDPNLRPITNEREITAVCHKYGITPPYLLYLGTLQPRKNLIRLLEAYAHANLPHQLVLAGNPGWLSRPILAAIKALPAEIAARVCLTGYVDEEDKGALLSAATALVFPSLYEGFGFPVLEAQVCETAVLCANTSSLPEVANDAALYVNPTDTNALTAALIQIATDNDLRQQLIMAGKTNARRFNWETTARQVLHSLEQASGLPPKN